MLAGAGAELAVLREAAPVGADQLFVGDAMGGQVEKGLLFHGVIGGLEEGLDHVGGHAWIGPLC